MMTNESSSGAFVWPAWSAECYAALAEALVTDDADRCRRLMGAAMAADAAFSAWFVAPWAGDAFIDSQDLARRLAAFRACRAQSSEQLRCAEALVLRSALMERVAAFQQALDDARLTALAEFAAGAGHEMNNPLAVISGRAQLLLRGETDDTRRADLALIKAQATRVHEMIADLMLFARPPAPVRKLTDLCEIVRAAIEKLRDAAAQKQVQLIAKMPDAPVMHDVDASQFEVALRALVENGINAKEASGQVVVEVDRSPTHITLSVRDNGPGISPAERELIFDPYYSGRQAGRGLGMGLPKCWRIIQQHGGTLTVREAPGGGSEFVITLPTIL